MLTTNNSLLAKLAEDHIQMVIAHNQLAEAHRILISQLVQPFTSEQTETEQVKKPKLFTPDTKPLPTTLVMEAPEKEIKPAEPVVELPPKTESTPAPTVAEERVKTPKAEINKPADPVIESPEAESKPEPVDIESLDLRHIVALSVLFGDKALKPDTQQLAKAKATFATEKADSITGQIDALYCTLNGISKIKTLAKATTYDLCLEMLASWDTIFGITERREFALSLLRELPTPAEVKPIDFEALRSEASACITQLVKGGYRNEALNILAKFNAKKLGDITDDKLAQFIELAESALAG